MTTESLSVVMPVHNAMPHLPEAVASIRRQTHGEFEFVILDDASTDGAWDVMREQAELDPRIRLERSDRNLGPMGAGNRLTELASGSLVARMDADDVCAPDRLERQLAALAAAPDAVVVGTMCDGLDAAGRRVRGRDRWRLLRRSMFPPFPHGSMMVRRDDVLAVGGYREDRRIWHDVDLILRLSERGRILVLPEALYRFRYHTGSVTHARDQDGLDEEADVMWRRLRERGGRPPADPTEWVESYMDALLLWSGHAPRGRATPSGPLRRARHAWQRRHPASLRALLRVLVAARDRASGLAIRDGRVREWRYG